MAEKTKLDVTRQVLNELKDGLSGEDCTSENLEQVKFVILCDIAMSLAIIAEYLRTMGR